jgi:hypothetical protein
MNIIHLEIALSISKKVNKPISLFATDKEINRLIRNHIWYITSFKISEQLPGEINRNLRNELS